MFTKYFCIAIFFSLFATASVGQTEDIPLNIRLTTLTTSDSLWLTATVVQYKKPCSLMLTAALSNFNLTDTIFLPVIDSESIFCLVVPPGTKGDLILHAHFFPGIFTVSGQLNAKKEHPNVRAILLTQNNTFYDKELVLDEDNKFKLPPLVFQNKAGLVFNYENTKKSKDHPDIILNNIPYAANFKQLIFSDTIKYAQQVPTITSTETIPGIATVKKGNDSPGKFKTLSEINLKTKAKTRLEKFNETYSTGLFNDPGENVIDCLDNDYILAFGDCITFLQTRVPGLSVSRGEYTNVQIKWRGKEVKAFYIDEVEVDVEQLLSVNTADIAMIKTYSPPFFGSAANGDGGAIAVYTRKAEYRRSDRNENKWLFTIKGYSPPIHVLFAGK